MFVFGVCSCMQPANSYLSDRIFAIMDDFEMCNVSDFCVDVNIRILYDCSEHILEIICITIYIIMVGNR